ncbi:MAG: tetratricopeptide repeat protein [Dysgonamonadaceae bacterium]
MEDDELDITELLNKYEQMRAHGKKMYLDADEFSMLIEYYFSIGNLEEADNLTKEGLAMHPGSQELMIIKAKELVDGQYYEEALNYIDSISDDGDIDIPLLKIECLIHLDKKDDADTIMNDLFERELSIDQLYTIDIEIGFIYNDVDEYEKAIPYLEDSLKIDSTNTEVLNDLSYAYEMLSNFPKAIEYNNQLLDIDPYSFESWVNLGKLYSMNGAYGKAVDAFDFALTINDGDVNALKLKALAMCLNGNAEEAIHIFKECLKETPDDTSLYDSLFISYEALKEYDQMLKIINMKEEHLGSKGIIMKRAWVYILDKQIEKAKELYKQIPESEHDTFDYYCLEGELDIHEENYIDAEKAYMKAALLSEDNDNVINRLSIISVALGKLEQAADYLEQLFKLDPNFPDIKSRIAIVRFEIGSKEPFDKTMELLSDDDLRNLLELIDPESTDIIANLNRENLLLRLDEARENRLIYKNNKY